VQQQQHPHYCQKPSIALKGNLTPKYTTEDQSFSHCQKFWWSFGYYEQSGIEDWVGTLLDILTWTFWDALLLGLLACFALSEFSLVGKTHLQFSESWSSNCKSLIKAQNTHIRNGIIIPGLFYNKYADVAAMNSTWKTSENSHFLLPICWQIDRQTDRVILLLEQKDVVVFEYMMGRRRWWRWEEYTHNWQAKEEVCHLLPQARRD
jgi:hypothetical protein